MDPIVSLVFSGIIGLLALGGRYYLSASKRRRIQAWCEAAARADLLDIAGETALWSSGVFTARLGLHRLRLEELRPSRRALPDGGINLHLRLTIEGTSGITLRSEESVLAHERFVGPHETEVGDATFDGEVFVQGPPECLRAVLDSETRRIVRPLLAGRIAARGVPGSALWADVAIRDGDIVVDFRDQATALLQLHFPAVLETLVDAANRLQRPASVVTRIVENTREDPEWRVRLENLRLLVRQYPRHAATPAALEHACHDERQEIQLEASLALGADKAEATLLEIASAEWSADPVAGQAVAALGMRIPPERVQAILDHALRTRRHETAGACLELLGMRGGPAVVEPLAKVLSLVSGELAVTAARALGASQAAGAEAPLLAALANDANDVRVAAAQALGEVGSASAVLPLKEVAERDRRDGSLQKAAREAVAAIQSRLGGATPGQLSLAENDGGRLSLADEDPRGRVSIADPGRPKGT